jgi:hypothetical protein
VHNSSFFAILMKENTIVLGRGEGKVMISEQSMLNLTDKLRKQDELVEMKYDYYKRLLRDELRTYKQIKVPTKNFSISNEEFVDWSIELLSPQELHEVIMMIRYAKNRGTNVRPFLETIAVGIVNMQ